MRSSGEGRHQAFVLEAIAPSSIFGCLGGHSRGDPRRLKWFGRLLLRSPGENCGLELVVAPLLPFLRELESEVSGVYAGLRTSQREAALQFLACPCEAFSSFRNGQCEGKKREISKLRGEKSEETSD